MRPSFLHAHAYVFSNTAASYQSHLQQFTRDATDVAHCRDCMVGLTRTCLCMCIANLDRFCCAASSLSATYDCSWHVCCHEARVGGVRGVGTGGVQGPRQNQAAARRVSAVTTFLESTVLMSLMSLTSICNYGCDRMQTEDAEEMRRSGL